MAENEKQLRPTRTTLIAGGLVAAGFALTSLSWWFLLLAALGTFGPGILRELGWLCDKDEFQIQAARRAGYHAFLACGLMAFVLVAFVRSGERSIQDAEEFPSLFLAALWFSWFLSSLMDFWGPQKMAVRVLLAFGSAWLVFSVVSNLGSEWTGWAALLLHPLLTLPFFAMAWLSYRWPRVTGVLLLAVVIFFVQFFGVFRSSNLGLVTQGVTFILFLCPLIACGVALLGVADESDNVEDGAGLKMKRTETRI
jgi:hypothetical protein